MRDYSNWKASKRAVANLKLDSKNPRIPPTGRPMTQADLAAELIEHDDVYGLARGITANGFFPTEPLLVVDKGGEKVVIEGNRRLAALKALMHPDLAPGGLAKKFRRLASGISPSQIARVDTILAPSRDAAVPLILERHTRTQIAGWKPAMQAAFYRMLKEGGATDEELAESYGVRPADLADSLRKDAMYRAACSLDLDPAIAEKIRNPRKFPLSTLERAMEYPDVRDFLRIEGDPDDVFVGRGSKADFKKAFARIVSDVAEGTTVTSRTLNTKRQVRDYLARIVSVRPSRKKRGRFTMSDLIDLPEPPPSPKAPSPAPRRRRASKSVVPRAFKCGVLNRKISDVFAELRGLDVAKFPNASALMLRTLLELCTVNYLDVTAEGKAGVNRLKEKKAPQKPDWYPGLNDQLMLLIEEMDLGLGSQELRALKRFRNSSDTPVSLDSLNLFVHNKLVAPPERELRRTWDVLEPLFEIILANPVPPEKR